MKKVSLVLIATHYYTTSLMLVKQLVRPFDPRSFQRPDDKVMVGGGGRTMSAFLSRNFISI
jgi:hypothetical protein